MSQAYTFLPRFSQISTAVIVALMAPVVSAEYNFDNNTSTHVWTKADSGHAIHFRGKDEPAHVLPGQNIRLNETSARWLLGDFSAETSYSLDKVSFNNAPSEGAHKFFAIIDGTDRTTSVPLDPKKTYVTINELRLGLNTSLQLSGNLTDKTIDIKKLVITTDTAEGFDITDYDRVKNAVNIQAWSKAYGSVDGTSSSIALNQVVVEDNASVAFNVKGNEALEESSKITVDQLVLGEKSLVISGYAYGGSGASGKAFTSTLMNDIQVRGDAEIVIDNGTLTLASIGIDEGKKLSLTTNETSVVDGTAGVVVAKNKTLQLNLKPRSILSLDAETKDTEMVIQTYANKSGHVKLGENSTLTGDQVSVTGLDSGASGNLNNDLSALAQVVQKDGKSIAGVEVIQQATDIYDGGSALTTQDGGLTNVEVKANSNINGIAEMTAVGLHIWRNEINDMNKRLGELRDSRDDANGVWARVYNGKAKFGDQKITNKYTAFQFGYDRQVSDGLWLGGALSWTDGDNDFAVGGGDNSVMAFTAYGSKLWDNGLFVDVTGKYGRLKNEFDISLPNGHSSADYHANALSVSAEAGWRVYPFNNGFFVEPQVEMMYGHVESVDYTTSTGVKVNQDSAETLIGRAGFMMGFKCPADRGNAYVRASVLHDWEGDANFKFGKDGNYSRTISETLGGTWYEYGIGANFNATKQLHIYTDVEAASGGEVDTDYRVNVGMRYAF